MTAGHLAMQVLYVRSVASNELVPAGKLGLEFSRLAREALIPIWPPAHTMSHQDIKDLAERPPAGPVWPHAAGGSKGERSDRARSRRPAAHVGALGDPGRARRGSMARHYATRDFFRKMPNPLLAR